MSSSGKVLTIFLIITAILLISLTALSMFFFQKETERRKVAEVTLEEYRSEKTKLTEELTKVKKQSFLLQEKNKEADARINDLSDELELEKGLRNEMKIEATALKEQMEATLASRETLAEEIKAKAELHDKLAADLAASERKIKELEGQARAEAQRRQEEERLEKQRQQQGKASQMEAVLEEVASVEAGNISNEGMTSKILNSGVELEEIVVVPGEISPEEENIAATNALSEEMVVIFDEALEGRVLSVDIDTEFVIVNLGIKDGVVIGSILSVYHGEKHKGDIKITRLQLEMSAADLIPPFSIRNVRKNDQVKVKE